MLAAAVFDDADVGAADVGVGPEVLAVLPEPEEQPVSVAAMAAVAPAPIKPRLVMFSMFAPFSATCSAYVCWHIGFQDAMSLKNVLALARLRCCGELLLAVFFYDAVVFRCGFSDTCAQVVVCVQAVRVLLQPLEGELDAHG